MTLEIWDNIYNCKRNKMKNVSTTEVDLKMRLIYFKSGENSVK